MILSRRYFEELADGEKFKPGTVSDQLREAIGLHQDKIPIWVYRMRVLGYPPGWLKIADMSKTVIPIHDGSEESEKVLPPQEATYNVESLVVYPGFNAPLPDGIHDVNNFSFITLVNVFSRITRFLGCLQCNNTNS